MSTEKRAFSVSWAS